MSSLLSTGCYTFSRYKTGKLDATAAAAAGNNNSSSSDVKTDPQQAAAAEAPSSEEAKPVLVVPDSGISCVLNMAEAFYWVSPAAQPHQVGHLEHSRGLFGDLYALHLFTVLPATRSGGCLQLYHCGRWPDCLVPYF